MLAAPAVTSAVVGLAGSYVAIRHYLTDLGWLSWVAPAVLELTVAYLAVSMVFRARMGTPWRPERLFVYAGIGLAVYLNWHAYPDLAASGRLWHAAMPLLWAVAIEWGLAWARALLRLSEPPRSGVPLGVWVTRPWFAASVQRLMWATGTRTYGEALTRHLHHALARAEHRRAGTDRLTAIRLRYAVVRPSDTALSAGDGPSARQPIPGTPTPAAEAATPTRRTGTARRGRKAALTVEELEAKARDLDAAFRAEHGRPISAQRLAEALRIGKPRANELTRRLRADHDTEGDDRPLTAVR